MAIGLLILFCRLGGALGSNFTAALIYQYCNCLYIIFFGLYLGSTVLTYYILQKVDKPTDNN